MQRTRRQPTVNPWSHTARASEDGAKRRLVRAKSNLGPDGDGFEYDLDSVPLSSHPGISGQRVIWGGPLDGHARTLLAEVERPSSFVGDGATALGEARQFLLDLLAPGPVPAGRVKAEAEDAGLASKTVRNAKDSLGVISFKTGMDSCWYWKLPEGVQDDPKMPITGGRASSIDHGHLRGDVPNHDGDAAPATRYAG